jgi:hypothetical protein
MRSKKTKTRTADKFITNTGVNIWNTITSKLETNTSLNVFKKSLASFLINKHYD